MTDAFITQDIRTRTMRCKMYTIYKRWCIIRGNTVEKKEKENGGRIERPTLSWHRRRDLEGLKRGAHLRGGILKLAATKQIGNDIDVGNENAHDGDKVEKGDAR